MINKFFIAFIVLAVTVSCSKDKDPDYSDKTLRATYTFSPGASDASIGWENRSSGKSDYFNDVNALRNITDDVRVGDNIVLFMNGYKDPVGNFSIRLSINGKQVSEVNGGKGNMNIQLFYSVSKKDFE